MISSGACYRGCKAEPIVYELTNRRDIVRDILKAHVPEDKWEHTGTRIQGFKNGYGTVSSLSLPDRIPLYKPLTPQITAWY